MVDCNIQKTVVFMAMLSAFYQTQERTPFIQKQCKVLVDKGKGIDNGVQTRYVVMYKPSQSSMLILQ